MSENSLPPVSISSWLREATERLRAANIQTARLDALVILADEVGRDKSWLLAHDDHLLTKSQQAALNLKLTARIKRTPLAYIRGRQEFFGRNFLVTPAVLIPRPETEALIELIASLKPQAHDTLVDVGTGSGAIAVTAKLEYPLLNVIATDISHEALGIARQNAKQLHADVAFIQQDLLEVSPSKPAQFIVANLPYVSKDWERSAETAFEPALALFAEDEGLALIKKLVHQSIQAIAPAGYLLLEADPRQHQAIQQVAQIHGYKLVADRDFCLVLQRA